MAQILLGVDRVARQPDLLAGMGRIGVVSNQSATSSEFKPVAEVVADACFEYGKQHAGQERSPQLVAVFGPQHGYFQTEQDNMIETPDTQFVYHAPLGEVCVPLFSLYKLDSRSPAAGQLAAVDTLIVDLPDVGCRVYTYLMTLAYCLQAASEVKDHPVRVVVLDRPNPIGLCHRLASGQWANIEGNLLNPSEAMSFSGERYKLPFRHGLTMGELGRLFVEVDKFPVQYDVITVSGLRRDTPLLALSRLPFVLPSPNMPSWPTAFVYPATVFYEATNMSEGRGTTRPFELIGAPMLDVSAIAREFARIQQDTSKGTRWGSMEGLSIRQHQFRPTFSKHVGRQCHGLQLHFDTQCPPENANMFAVGMRLLHIISRLHPSGAPFVFAWRPPSEGYEFNRAEYAITLQCGSTRWRPVLERGSEADLDNLLRWAQDEANAFAEQWQHLFLY